MEEIVLTEDDLIQLEKRFGPGVRFMGPWISDGTFGYTSVPLSVVRKAAGDLANKGAVFVDLSRLEDSPERTAAFLKLLHGFGHPLVAAIVAAYRESSADRRPLVRNAAA